MFTVQGGGGGMKIRGHQWFVSKRAKKGNLANLRPYSAWWMIKVVGSIISKHKSKGQISLEPRRGQLIKGVIA